MAIAEIQSCTTRKTCPIKNHKMLTNLGMQPTKVWEFKNQGNWSNTNAFFLYFKTANHSQSLDGISIVLSKSATLNIIENAWTMDRWEFQERKMEALYHMFGNTLRGYSLKFRPYVAIYIYGRYLQVGILKFPFSGVEFSSPLGADNRRRHRSPQQ